MFGKPNQETIKFNDKKFLPLNQNLRKSNSKSFANRPDRNIFTDDYASENMNTKQKKIVNYPYRKDNIGELIEYKHGSKIGRDVRIF